MGRRETWAIIIAGFAFTVLMVAIGYWLYEKKLEYNSARQYHPGDYTQQPSGICLKLPGIVNFCPREQGGPRAETQRSDDDLKSQQEMADWAFDVVLFSAGGFILSLFGVVLVYATFRATRDGNLINLRVGRAQVRAYLTIRDVKFKIIGADNPVASIHFRYVNTGNSPARSVRIANSISIYRLPSFPRMEREVIYEKPATTLRKMPDIPASAVEIRKYLFPNIDITKLTDIETRPNNIEIAVGFSVKWIDVFDDEQGQDFQFLIFADAPLVVGGKGLKLPPYAGEGVDGG